MSATPVSPYPSAPSKTFRAETASLDEWVRFIAAVYFHVNEDMEPLDLWMQVVNDSCILAEDIRKGELDAAGSRIVKMFGWMAAFVGKYLYAPEPIKPNTDPIGLRLRRKVDTYTGLDESYGKWILEKYPNACAKCGDKRCRCAVYRKEMEERKEKDPEKKAAFAEIEREFREERQNARDVFSKQSDGRPNDKAVQAIDQPLDSLVRQFIRIYGSGHYDTEIWRIAAHLQEEVGEVALELVKMTEIAWYHSRSFSMSKVVKGAIKQKEEEGTEVDKSIVEEVGQLRGEEELFEYLMSSVVEKLKEELADVFTWLTAMLHKINQIKGDRGAVLFAGRLKKHCAPDPKREKARCGACLKETCEYDCLARTLIGSVLLEKIRKV